MPGEPTLQLGQLRGVLTMSALLQAVLSAGSSSTHQGRCPRTGHRLAKAALLDVESQRGQARGYWRVQLFAYLRMQLGYLFQHSTQRSCTLSLTRRSPQTPRTAWRVPGLDLFPQSPSNLFSRCPVGDLAEAVQVPPGRARPARERIPPDGNPPLQSGIHRSQRSFKRACRAAAAAAGAGDAI